MNPRLQHYAELGVGLVVLALGWYYTPEPAPVGTIVLATPAPQLKGVPTQDITPPRVKVYAPPAKRKLDLPAEVRDDPNKYVLTSVRLPKDTHPLIITTVIDATTGDVQTYKQRAALPWLATEQTGEIRIDYGVKNHLEKVWRLSLREDLLQVKALHAGINLGVDTDGTWFAGFGAGYRW